MASRVLFVNDGSDNRTWQDICGLTMQWPECRGISRSRNHDLQNALLCGLIECRDQCDITISIDCDGQDDIDAMNQMVEAYLGGRDVVYGVRDNLDTDTTFKRVSAQGFYRLIE